ncbi:hypothetical protein B9Q13_04045 [Candidatus Marsarchaeota G2 archaeon ECH_B_SAG-G16]|jgi:hypothetical protein|uniref:Uncharacterized protein n=6 Tax=Candidatus Marsarchaeota TaxID=1978152 RepID=A0A2R6AG45_9ARCH|nr:MAG: hypothetical protein B9Q01_05520 [Candidatus Marsarchaeota G1 archaeon OSP_D]PSN85319.1 MAG: hypothetical protein B9Q02_06845 [Candidatus Marsarchaeota G1 archaeon BE_D]PSN87783.1 MAG: hypothetical protein B9Q00_07800 [Candidatus Marsarchaeota G1 archaeon OSP_C]PSO04640.1 MAG: hypothetical protein B9Q13_04045 [Candidatus Marsarchaeota G2 archaeon ECH_B_SAG-G16]
MLYPFLWAIALSMVYIIARVLKWACSVRHTLSASLVVFVLSMMVAMFAGATIYLYNPSFSTLTVAAWLNLGVMSAALVPIFVSFVSRFQEQSVKQLKNKSAFFALVIFLTLLNEFFMGWSFNLVFSPHPRITPEYLSSVVSSYWFVFPMSLEMALTTYFLRKNVPKSVLFVVAMQSAIMFFSPTALSSRAWGFLSAFVGSALMTILFAWVYARGFFETTIQTYLFRLILIYLAMMLGLYIWGVNQNPSLFALSVILEMLLYFDGILSRLHTSGEARRLSAPWIVSTFVANSVSQFFMGGLIALTGLIGAPSAFKGELVFSNIAFYALTLVVTLFITLFGLLFTLSETLQKALRLPSVRAKPIFVALGFSFLPLADLTPLDALGDANPSFHMFEHLVIALGGFIAGFALSSLRSSSARLSSLYSWYTKNTRNGVVVVAISAALLSFWFSPKMFMLIYLNDTIHGLLHITILLIGFLAGTSFCVLPKRLRLFLVVAFSWMAPMMAPFSFVLGAYSYPPTYFVDAMSATMEVFSVSVVGALLTTANQRTFGALSW